MKKLRNEVFPSDILKPSLVLFTKYCIFCFFILSVFIYASVGFAAERFVRDQYPTIQDAINASSTGDTIYVADGIYKENILFPPGKNITLISENGPVSTIIDGNNNGSVVTFATGNESILYGFTITNGLTPGNGGGVRIGSVATPIIDNCIITDNEALAGGGISCGDSSAPLITNSIIQNNSATGDSDLSNGGGIHLSPLASANITNCIIQNNSSDRNGGGLAFDTADEPWIVNCIFSNNTAVVNGGAISFNNSAPIITNCTFSNNIASVHGGAIACSNPLLGTAVTNSIFWGDSPAEITCDSAIISVTYSAIQGEAIWPEPGNINLDPKFVDEENGDFHLLNDSPCIDAGDNSAPALPATDIDGDDRKIDDPAVADTGNGTPPIVDMGSYELNCNVVDCSIPTTTTSTTTTTTTLPSATTTTLPPATTTTTTLPSEPAPSGGGGGGGGGGIFGDILKSSVIGYHLDGWTSDGIEIYMPVTKGFKALKGAQEFVRSFAPDLAEFVRECFDLLEKKADANKDGFLYQSGTHIFPILGNIAEKSLELIGQEEYIADAYSKTTISVKDFRKLQQKGIAIAPKTVKEIEKFNQKLSLSEVFN